MRVRFCSQYLTRSHQQLVACLARLLPLSPSHNLVPSGFFDAPEAAAASQQSSASWLSCSPQSFQAAMDTVNTCVDELTEVCLLLSALNVQHTWHTTLCNIRFTRIFLDSRPSAAAAAAPQHAVGGTRFAQDTAVRWSAAAAEVAACECRSPCQCCREPGLCTQRSVHATHSCVSPCLRRITHSAALTVSSASLQKLSLALHRQVLPHPTAVGTLCKRLHVNRTVTPAAAARRPSQEACQASTRKRSCSS